jgi:hypothetical protein
MKPSLWRGPWPWLVVGLFVVAVVYVRAVVADPDAADRRAAGTTAHQSMSHGNGLSDSHNGYVLAPVTLPTQRGPAVPLTFRILGPDGVATTDYQPTQDRPLHVYVVREDLSVYQHVHPQLVGDTWTTTVSVPDGGAYRIYTEFVPRQSAGPGHPTLLGIPFIITGDTTYVPLPPPAPSVRIGGFTVNRMDAIGSLPAGKPTSVRFQVLDASGAAVPNLEPYLGAYAHLSAFAAFDQSLTHLHPALPANSGNAPSDGMLTFHTLFHRRGEQRMFLQFQIAGTVHLAAFTVDVT